MRGCSLLQLGDFARQLVFPAYAGMFLDTYPRHERYVGFPRVCGDVPPVKFEEVDERAFSPRMRGCS